MTIRNRVGVGLLLGGVFFSLLAAPADTLTLTNEWSLILRDSSDSCPAIAPDGTLYFGTFKGKLLAVRQDGTIKWTFLAGREIKSSPTLGVDGTLYFGCRDRKFYAVGSDGRKKWDFKTGGWVDSSPGVAAEGNIYFGSWDRNFYALDQTGAKKWQFQTAGPVVSSPAIGLDGAIYFGSHDHKLYALKPDGTKAWDYPTGGPIISSPAIDNDGTLYFTSVDGFFHAVNSNGSTKWRLSTGGVTESSPVIGQDGTIYVGVNDKLWAILPEGKKKWEQPYAEQIRASPLALADGSVCFLSGSGVLLDLDTLHHPKWATYLANSLTQPAVARNGVIYAAANVQNLGQVLYAFPTKELLAKSSWPKFHATADNRGIAAPHTE
jgi:outer membrane protein assembly factor BamB